MKEKQQQAIESEMVVSNPTHPKPLRPRLANIKHVRLEIAAVYKEARTGVIPTQEATRLVYMLISLGNMIRDSELEERIAKLEKNIK